VEYQLELRELNKWRGDVVCSVFSLAARASGLIRCKNPISINTNQVYMAAKQKPAEKPKAPKAKGSVTVYQKPDESPDAASARVLNQPETQAALTVQQWQGGIVDVDEIAKELRRQTETLQSGDMYRAESMLLAQAHTLDELFNNLARKAHRQEYLSSYDSFLKLALKAQNQCRATLETLSNIKNPPVVYAKQANIAHGPQQVNNGPHAAENQNQQNKLLTVNHGETLDSIGTGETIGSNPALEAVG
jgi:hypothetical protein